MHTFAIEAFALWLVAQVKLKRRSRFAHPDLVTPHLGGRRLPDLSCANVRELLLTVFPLNTLTKDQALQLVTKPLMNRTKSTKSRFKGTKIQI